MMQKLLLSLLALTVIGAVGIGLYDAARPAVDAAVTQEIMPAADNVVRTPEEKQAALDAVAAPVAASDAVDSAAGAAAPAENGLQVQQQSATDMVGTAWLGSGTVTVLDAVGVVLTLSDGIEVYVELGPAMYQQQQGVALAAGDVLTVEGFFNGEQIHAQTITLSNGTQYAFRTAEGQPLWSGGANGNGQGSAQTDAGGQSGLQVAADAWLTYSGVITVLSNGSLTMQIPDGTLLQVQVGQPNFWQAQGVVLAIGDEIEALGFYEGEQFQVGEIRKTVTGERIMLRDPNGRPLWGGPGRNGAAGGGTASNQAGATVSNSAAGTGTRGQGNGNGYMGGR